MIQNIDELLRSLREDEYWKGCNKMSKTWYRIGIRRRVGVSKERRILRKELRRLWQLVLKECRLAEIGNRKG